MRRNLFWWNKYGSEQRGLELGRKYIYYCTQKYGVQWDWRGKDAWDKRKVDVNEALEIIELHIDKINSEELKEFLEAMTKQIRNEKERFYWEERANKLLKAYGVS
jgi:hypothetical protein